MGTARLDQILRSRAEERPEQLLVVRGEERWTYGAADAAASRYAAGLRELGVGAADRIVLALGNGPDFLVAYYGALRAGACVVPVPHDTPLDYVRMLLADSRASAFAGPQGLGERLAEHARELPQLRWLLCPGASTARVEGSLRVVDPADFASLDVPVPDAGAGDRDPALILYTSGTTARPKGVLLSHGALARGARDIVDYLALTPDDRAAVAIPMFLAYGDWVHRAHMTAGATLILFDAQTSPDAAWRILARQRCTTFPTVPSSVPLLMMSSAYGDEDLRELRRVILSGAPARPEAIARLRRALRGARVHVFYGQSEAGPRLTGLPPEDLERKAGSVGLPVPGVALRIVGEDGAEVPPGNVGEVVATGANFMTGYWNSAEDTARVLSAQGLRTGDLGHLDAEGYLFLSGRKDDVLKVGGYRVSPNEIERVIEELPTVAECAVLAGADAVLGDTIVALVVAAPGVTIDATSVFRACRERLPAFKVPTRVEVVAALPRGPGGKLLRRQVAIPARSAAASGDRTRPTLAALRSWLVQQVSTRLGVSIAEVHPYTPLSLYGLGSLHAVALAGDLSTFLNSEVSPVSILNSTHIADVARTALGERGSPARAPRKQPRTAEPIAVVGMGCRYPSASTPRQYWQLLRNGVDAVTEVPKDRWNMDEWFDTDPQKPGKTNSKWGGFLEQQYIESFDAPFFQISPRAAHWMDPQQRIALEVAHEAFEDAGMSMDRLAGSRTAVYVGAITPGWEGYALMHVPLDRWDAYAAVGRVQAIVANRISHVFDLRGPSMVVDTACSASLIAVHLAVQSLCDGESDIALAGGVRVLLRPENYIPMAKAGMLSPDGRCKAFDASANGFVRSEGCGFVVLKRLSEAVADGDDIYAVIRGSAINEDGRGGGLTVPQVEAQERVVREAYARARTSPREVSYVEAHGTGTSLGDPIEMSALANVLLAGRGREEECVIGSVKTNLGHLEPVAGIAGLMKVALMIKNRAIPPNLHFQTPNPRIPFDQLPVRIPTSFERWPRDRQLLAGVSSFGIGGANAHAVLSDVESVADGAAISEAKLAVRSTVRRPTSPKTAPFVLPLSAATPSALKSLARSFATFLGVDGAGADLTFADVCYSASCRRSHHEQRLAVVASRPADAVLSLERFAKGEPAERLSTLVEVDGQDDAAEKLVFVFSGQGQQWWAMGRALFDQEPVFRETIERIDALLRPHTGWSLCDELRATEERSRIADTEIAQPAIFALQVALAELWKGWNIKPAAVVGHSIGEVAAAYVAGILDLETAVRIVGLRGRIMQKTTGKGSMVSVELPAEEAASLAAPFADRLSVAAQNGPRSTVLAGARDAIEELRRTLAGRGIEARAVPVNCAFHSPQMDEAAKELARVLADVHPAAGTVALASTLSGNFEPGTSMDGAYWGKQVRSPVLFAKAIDTLVDRGHRIFLEVSAHPVLAADINASLRAKGAKGTVVASLRRKQDDRTTILEALGSLYAMGAPVAWEAFYPETAAYVKLPTYPWERRRYWPDVSPGNAGPTWASMTKASNHLLERPLVIADHRVWEVEVGTKTFPWLADHRVETVGIVPGFTYVEMAVAAAAEVFGEGTCVVTDMEFKNALLVPEEGATRTVQVLLSIEGTGTGELRVNSRAGSDPDGAWTLHATCKIRPARRHEGPADGRAMLESSRTSCTEVQSGDLFYQTVATSGFDYGPSFKSIEHVWSSDKETVAKLRVPDIVSNEGYVVHPALWDAFIQPGHLLRRALQRYLPVRIEEVRLYGRPTSRELWCRARRRLHVAGDLSGGPQVDYDVFDANGICVAEIVGLESRALTGAGTAEDGALARWMYQVEWHPTAAESPQTAKGLECALILGPSTAAVQNLRDALSALGTRTLTAVGAMRFANTGDHYEVPWEDRDAFDRVLIEADAAKVDAVICAFALDANAAIDTRRALENVLHVIHKASRRKGGSAPRLWLLTAGAQPARAGEQVAPFQAPVWGFGRVVSNEHPELRCTLGDLDLKPSEASIKALAQAIRGDGPEGQFAWRDGERFEARLARQRPADPDALRTIPRGEAAVRLEVTRPGVLDSLRVVRSDRQMPGAHEVEVHVRAAGLNYRDIMKATGLYPLTAGEERAEAFGVECAGVVSAVGKDVANVRVGDEVILLCHPRPAVSTYVTVSGQWVVKKPMKLSWAEAATNALAFITVLHSFEHLAHLQPGERVLIHAATGGVGLAAIQVARRLGAEIFATAGSEEKRKYLRDMGIQHVMDSRSLDFAQQVMELTSSEGVDVVLDSVGGEFVPRGLSTLRQGGRFVELGKADFVEKRQLVLGLLQRNLSFFAVDIPQLKRTRAPYLISLLTRVADELGRGDLEPLPVRECPVEAAEDVFREMAQARHIGKRAITMTDASAPVTVSATRESTFKADGTYLITGGLGGLGLTLAEWMSGRGVRHLALVGRSRPSPSAEAILATLRRSGVDVRVLEADVSDSRSLGQAIAEIEREMPPLRGVFHAAGVLDDGVVANLDMPRIARVLAPKIDGAWNLHNVTAHLPLEMFVLFSSASALMCSTAQASYAAANAFLDALAHHRWAQGRSALSINWGPWTDVGMAAADANRGERLARTGMQGITPRAGIRAMELALARNIAQVAVMSVDWSVWRSRQPALAASTFFAPFAAPAAPEANGHAAADGESTSPGQGTNYETYLREQVAKVLRLSVEEVKSSHRLIELGADSVVSIELRNRIELDFGVRIPILDLLNQGSNLAALSKRISDAASSSAEPPPAMP